MAPRHLSDAERDVPFLRGGFAGQGFGLGVSVVEDVAPGAVLGSVGQYGWGGAAGTFFWVDPQEELVAVLMVQQMTPEAIPVIANWKNLVYQAIAD